MTRMEINTLRKAIVSHPMWDVTRKTEGLTSDSLGVDTLRRLALRFGIVATVDDMTPNNNNDDYIPPYVPAPAAPVGPAPVVEAPAPYTPPVPYNEPAPAIHVEAPAPAPSIATPKAPQEVQPKEPAPMSESKAQQLLALITSIAGNAIDEAQVNALINKALEGFSVPERVMTLQIVQNEIVTKVEGVAHPMLPTLIRAMTARTPAGNALCCWLAGPAGSGKSTAVQQAAKALNLPFRVMGATSQAFEFMGFVNTSGYQSTPLVDTFRDGGVLCLDEVDRSSNESLLVLNGALANGIMSLPTGEQLIMHKDCYVAATANTYGGGNSHDYIGAAKIDAAFLDRWVRIGWDYDEVMERAISGNADWALRVQRSRGLARSKGLKVIISPRASIYGAALIAAGMTPDEAAGLTYLNGLTVEQKQAISG